MAERFFVKSDLTFGRNAILALPKILSECRAQNVLLVHGKGVKASGIAGKVLEKIHEAGVKITIFDRVTPNPTNEIVEEAAQVASEEKIDTFVSVGGGSAIDLAKAVNILMKNPGPIGQYDGIGLVKNPVLPLIAIPTTAGTSSEITNVIALTDTKAVRKYVIIDNKIIPDKVIADPEFTKTMPPSVTASTGMDAITHAIESYVSNESNALTKYNSLKGLQIFYKNLPIAVENGSDTQVRENMMIGCIIVGFGFSNANLGLVHAIAHTLSAHFHLAHGMANASVLPYVLAYNADSCPREMAELAEAIGLPLSGNADTDKYLLAEEMLRLTGRLKIRTLSEQGITENDLSMLAEETLKEPVLGFNPRQNVTKEDVLKILEKAF